MVKLQTPKYVVRNSELIGWDQAVLHIGCEGVNRGLSVFEGIKGYWRQDGSLAGRVVHEEGSIASRQCWDRELVEISCEDVVQSTALGCDERILSSVEELMMALEPENRVFIKNVALKSGGFDLAETAAPAGLQYVDNKFGTILP